MTKRWWVPRHQMISTRKSSIILRLGAKKAQKYSLAARKQLLEVTASQTDTTFNQQSSAVITPCGFFRKRFSVPLHRSQPSRMWTMPFPSLMIHFMVWAPAYGRAMRISFTRYLALSKAGVYG